MPPRRIAVGLLGCGVVGAGVYARLRDDGERVAQHIGCPLVITRVLVRDPARPRAVDLPKGMVTEDAQVVLDDPDIDIIIEVMGGETPAHEIVQRALRSHKHVVTANKQVVAKHGPALRALALDAGVGLRYEASVGGGVPLIAPLQRDLPANRILAIHAIINGTTNYVLTRMGRENTPLDDAIAQAQSLGYAEADPSDDIEGTDAACKIAILATLAFGTPVSPGDVYRDGISTLAPRDFRYAEELGYAIKLLAIAKAHRDGVEARVHPTLVGLDTPLAKIDGVFNAVQIDGDLIGPVLLSGRGAGARPTTSAVLADVIGLARDIRRGVPVAQWSSPRTTLPLRTMQELHTRYYIRMRVADRPGVLAQIAQVLGDHEISIASVIQKEVDEEAQSAEIVIMTHRAREADFQTALARLRTLSEVVEIGSYLRVESEDRSPGQV